MAQLEPELRGIFCEFLVRLTHGCVFFLIIYFLAAPCSIWNLSPLTRDKHVSTFDYNENMHLYGGGWKETQGA